MPICARLLGSLFDPPAAHEPARRGTCRHCGQPIELDNTDDVIRFAVPALNVSHGDFWRHSDTAEGTGFTLCRGSGRYTPGATHAGPAGG